MINTVLTSIFGGLAALFVLAGFAFRSHRYTLISAGLFGAGAAAAAHNDAFWPMVVLGILSLWIAFAAVEVMDLGWRMRCALTVSACLLGFLVLWPTLPTWSSAIKCPAYIQEHVGSRLVAGLDLRGGLRLVYTVDVDEAIKDKRDHYYEDMRLEATKVYGLHTGDELPSDEIFAKLREKVEIDSPRRPADEIRVTVKEGTDPSKLDERFLEKFRGEMSFSRTQDQRSLIFKIRSTVGSQIRERAVEPGQGHHPAPRRRARLARGRRVLARRGHHRRGAGRGREELRHDSRDHQPDRAPRVQAARRRNGFLRRRAEDGQARELAGRPRVPDRERPGRQRRRGREAQQADHLRALAQGPERDLDPGAAAHARVGRAPWTCPPIAKSATTSSRAWSTRSRLKEEEIGVRTYFLKSRAEITGDMIRDAVAQPEQSQGGMGGWHVSITFTDAGGKIFEKITGANIKRRFAIILDGRISSAPVIQGKIAGGHGQITMGSGDPEAQLRDSKKLELVLRSGALPAPISPSNEQRIGPSLGQDAIKLGIQGALGGIALVLVFMMVYYQRAGFIADIAVLFNLFLQLAILCSFGASMTLPGIAGLALTVGMAVDSNILINERIREELGLGKSPRAAVDVGYKRALNAIIDGHVTTVISGLVLAQYGTGPLKGFAVTLIVGVICNIFTGVVVSRLMFDWWVKNLGRGAQLDLG